MGTGINAKKRRWVMASVIAILACAALVIWLHERKQMAIQQAVHDRAPAVDRIINDLDD